MRQINIDLKTGEIQEKPWDQKEYGFFGGRGIVAKYLTDHVDPTIDPLSSDNPLLLTTGYFTGTNVSSANRLSFGAKSPLTGGIKESNAGGTMARRLTDHQIKLIVFENQSDSWVYLYIDKEGQLHFEDATPYLGVNCYDFDKMMREKYNDRISVACIGMAGEHLGLISSIMITELRTGFACRACARGGMGAVMGSKKLKAIIVEHSPHPYIVEPPAEMADEFNELNEKITSFIQANPLTGKTMPVFGSAAGTDTTGPMGAMPYKNFSGEMTPGWERIGTKQLHENIVSQGGHHTIPCSPGCVVRCSNELYDRDGNYLTAGMEYETLCLNGPNLDIFDTDVIAKIDGMCDNYGMDTIDIGTALGVMMDKGVLEWGDAEGCINLLEHMFDEDSEYGPILKNGCAAMADYLGVPNDEIQRVPVSKRQAFAAYDPRAIRGYGLTWERGPMGADHTSGSAPTYLTNLTPVQQADQALATNCSCDCFMCLFPWAAVQYNPEGFKTITRMAGILAGYEEGPGPEMIAENGNAILAMEYAFNEKCGYKHENDYFYGGRKNYMYKVPNVATGATYTSIHDKPPAQVKRTQVKMDIEEEDS